MDDAVRVVETFGVVCRDSIERLDRDHGRDAARVFAVDVETTRGLRSLVVKRCSSARGFAQEQVALAQWFAAGHELGGAVVPELVMADQARAVLVMARVPGTPAPRDAPAVHRAAGRFLAALHQLAIVDHDPLPLAEALGRRHRSWLRACEAALSPGERRVAERFGPRPESFAGAVRVPCHRDFTPDNWLWDGRRLAVVDFEHARLDLALVDLAKLAVGPWSSLPALESAFFEGFGRRLTDAEYTRLRAVVVLHGLASLAWGIEHRSSRFVDEGHRALALAGAWADALRVWATSPSRTPL